MGTNIYVFEQSQLEDLLNGTIEMFQEYRDHHSKAEEVAKTAAVLEMIQGLDSERELDKYDPNFIVTSQIIPVEDDDDDDEIVEELPFNGLGVICQFK